MTVALASASPRRRELLASIGLDVRIITTSYDERPLPGRSPRETAVVHARGKVLGASPVPWLTIGADTVVDLDGETFGKPSDDAESRRMIARLAGRDHAVHTAFALRAPGGELVHEETTTTHVRFAALDDATIDDYVASGDGRDKAGAYGIQGYGATLIERIDGDYFTVVGFPLHAFARAVRALGYRLGARVAGMSVASTLRSTLSPDIGIDLGTANTVVYDREAGIIVSEPSVVAYRESDGAIIAVGSAAKELDGRAPGRVRVVRPLRGGTISDFRGAHTLISTMVDRALAARPRIAPRIVACIPGCATDIECKAVEEAVRAAGPRTTIFVPQAVAAAVGAGLDITTTRGKMIVDIGGGTTEIAVLSLSGVVALRSIKIGGDTFDAAIIAKLRNDERFSVGPLSAERLKIERGFAGRAPGREPLLIAGTDLNAGRPARRPIDEALVGEAMRDPIAAIVRAVWSILEATPPDLAADLLENGIMLSGGGALVHGLAGELRARTNVPTTVADEPLLAVARGAGEILASPSLLEHMRPHADRLTRWYQSLRIGMRESYSR